MARKKASKKAKKPSKRKGKNAYEPSLTEKRRAFIREFCLTSNATEAYRRAYNTDKDGVARTESTRLMKDPLVAAEIEKWRQEQQFKFNINAESLLQELAAIAFFDLRNVMTDDSYGISLKHWDDMPPHVSRAIQQVSETESQFGTNRSVKGYDKVRAIEMLGKRLGLWNGDNDGQRRSREEARRALFERLSNAFSKPKE